MIHNFYITGSKIERPHSHKTIFADGSSDSTFREDVDIELSHWVPNHTPEIYKADTSTEICMNFVENESSEVYDLAVNNHLDVDGILAVFTLVHSKFALNHKETIVSAAEMGDFWAYGDNPAQILFQGLTLYMEHLENQKNPDLKEIYEKCFETVFLLIDNDQSENFKINKGIMALEKSIKRIESGEIYRKVFHDRFVHYNIPLRISESNLERILHIPSFNSALTDDLILWPQSRNYYDNDKIQLVSIETKNGYYFDLFYPGYMWAETPDSWRAPGLSSSNSTNMYYFGYEPLNLAVEKLDQEETGEGDWLLIKSLTPFSTIKGRNFPVVLSFMKDEKPVESKLKPDYVAGLLANAFSLL